jgi:tetratricopeptide (TPR) repeat protein
MTDYFNKKEISQRAEDELLYEYVMEEMEIEPNLIKGLWAKAMAHSEGNNDKAKSLYMQYRVQSIKDDFKLLEIAYNELSKEKLWDTIKNSFGSDEEKQKIKQEQKVKQEEEKYGRIKGWLIFFAIILILGNLSYLQIFNFFTDDAKNNLELLYLNSQDSIAKTINISAYTMMAGLFFNILLTISFFSKAKSTKVVVITFLIFQILFGLINAGVTIQLNKEFPDLFTSQEFVTEVIMRPTIGSIMLLIWMFYFIFSTRVKKTFISQKDLGGMVGIALILPVLLGMLYISNINELSDNYNLRTKAMKLGNENLNNNDTNQAKEYYDKAIKLVSYSKYEVIEVANEIANKYFEKKDYDNAIHFYKIAVSKNDNGARFRLAYSYSAIKDYNTAIIHYENYLVKNKYEGAMRNVGLLYERIKEYKKAQQWFKKAFDIYIKKGRDGDKEASKWLALMYTYGEGVTKDSTKAKYWEDKAK